MNATRHFAIALAAAVLCASLAGCESRAEAQRQAQAQAAQLAAQQAAEQAAQQAAQAREAQRQTLASQLQQADNAHALASQAVAAQTRIVQALDEELAATAAEAARHKQATQDYLMAHKLAVAAIVAGLGGGAVALDDSGEFTQQARELAAVAGVVAVGWALFNMPEVLQVADAMVKAEARQRSLATHQANLAQALQAEHGQLQSAQAQLAQVGQQVASIRQALATL